MSCLLREGVLFRYALTRLLNRDRVIQGVVLGLDIWPILALFSIIVLVIATLISHTFVVPLSSHGRRFDSDI